MTACTQLSVAQILTRSKLDSLETTLPSLEAEDKLRAVVFLACNSNNTSLQDVDSLIHLAYELANTSNHGLGWARYAEAYHYRLMGRYRQALGLIYDNIEGEKEQEMSALLKVYTYGELANLYTLSHFYAQGESLYLNVLQSCQEHGFSGKELSTLFNLGNFYAYQEKADKSRQYYSLAASKASAVGDSLKYHINQASIAALNINHDFMNLDSSSLWMQKASQYFTRQGNENYAAMIQTDIGRVYTRQGKLELAEQTLIESVKSLWKYGTSSEILKALNELNELFKQKGDYKKAIEYQEEFQHYFDSLGGQSDYQQVVAMQAEYEKRLVLQQLSNQLDKSDIQRTMNIVMAIMIILLIITAYVTFQYYQVEKKRSRELKQNNQQIESQQHTILAQKADLEKMNDYKSKIIGVISHDLKSPLLNLHSMIYLFQKMDLSTSERERIVNLIRADIDHNLKLLDSLLSWSRSLLDKEKLQIEPVELRELINDEIEKSLAKAEEKSLSLTKELEDITVQSNPDLLRITLRNLISNAIKFTEEKGSVIITCRRQQNRARIEVADTGIGMNEEQLNKLLMGKVTSRSGTSGEKGSGLGILLSRDFLKLIGSELQATSQPGKGSTFSFEIENVEN